jgi:hypothetical protein
MENAGQQRYWRRIAGAAADHPLEFPQPVFFAIEHCFRGHVGYHDDIRFSVIVFALGVPDVLDLGDLG